MIEFSSRAPKTIRLIPLLVILLYMFSAEPVFAQIANDDFSSRIEKAQNATTQAFVAVSRAEREGANTTGLIVELNEAQRLLEEAEDAYVQGNLEEARNKIDQSEMITSKVTSDSSDLMTNATGSELKILWWRIAVSSFGIEIFLVVLSFTWDAFKRVYARKILRMRPEVPFDD